MNKDNFKYLSQGLDGSVLHLVKQTEFYSYEYMSDFEKFKEELARKEKFHNLLTHKKLVMKIMNRFLKFGVHLKDYHDLYLKC